MKRTRVMSLACGMLALSGAAAAVTSAAAASAGTPDTCMFLNGGDWNACNVGHSGRGDLPYVPAAPPHSVALCIQVNQGDAMACPVGSVDGFYPG
jgi:hypothetical protein